MTSTTKPTSGLLPLLVIASAQLMVVLDDSIVNIALPSNGRYRLRAYLVRHVLDGGDEGAQGRAALLGGGQGQCTETCSSAVERLLGGATHGDAKRIVPHDAAIQKTGCHEEGGVKPVLLQDRQGVKVVVSVPVVEGDCRSTSRQAP